MKTLETRDITNRLAWDKCGKVRILRPFVLEQVTSASGVTMHPIWIGPAIPSIDAPAMNERLLNEAAYGLPISNHQTRADYQSLDKICGRCRDTLMYKASMIGLFDRVTNSPGSFNAVDSKTAVVYLVHAEVCGIHFYGVGADSLAAAQRFVLKAQRGLLREYFTLLYTGSPI